MARIAGVDIPRDKAVLIALTHIYGIGREAVKLNSVVDEDIRMRETCAVLSVNRKTVPINPLHAA